MSEEYFHINLGHLQGEHIFPFTLYIYNAANKKYSVFLHGNSPLTDDKMGFLFYIFERSGELAVSMGQKRTFLKATELDESEIEAFNKAPDELEIKHQENVKKLEQKNENSANFKFKGEFKRALEEDDFSYMIQQAHDEILAFEPTISETVSTATYLAEIYLTGDNFSNRVTAISYFLAKDCDIVDKTSLGDLVVASFFYHLGLTQIDLSDCRNPVVNLGDEKRKSYSHHPGLSEHLIKKSGSNLSDRCKRIIAEHHERVDGSGAPYAKKGDFIDQLALVLGAASHILEFSDGRLNESKSPIKSVINSMKNKTFTPGLEFEFGDTISNNLFNLIEESEKLKAA
jgi:response regulator RpfG family c-di-GMP phosphodiesterase